MISDYFYNCFCPRIIDEDEIKRDSSDDSIATVLPFDFIPESEFNHHPVLDGARTPTKGAGAPIPISNTSCNSSAVATVYNTSVVRSNHGYPALVLSHREDQHDHRSTIEQLLCKLK